MKILHSADWQLGCRFSQFGDKAEGLRTTRLKTLRRSLGIAREKQVDAFIIAGDLFDDNHVEDSVVRSAVQLFSEFPEVPVFILPGNHDPYIGPASIWDRKEFRAAPSNVRVFRQPEYVEIEGGFVLASPLQQKKSTVDPSRKLDELAKKLPADSIKIGVTHGSPAIPSIHAANAFPIALDSATRAGLDYLALGDWHNWQVYDNGRLVMPGTPEQDTFDHTDSGFVAYAVIDARFASPVVERLRVGESKWYTFDLDCLNLETAKGLLQQSVLAIKDEAQSAVVRIRVRGSITREVRLPLLQWLSELIKPFSISQLHDESSLALTLPELEHLKANHPILAQVLSDLDCMASFATGIGSECVQDQLSPRQANELLEKAKIAKEQLTPAHFEYTRQMLLQKLQEAK